MSRTFQIQITGYQGKTRVHIRRESSDPCVSISVLNTRLARKILPKLLTAHSLHGAKDELWQGKMLHGTPDSRYPEKVDPNWRTFDNHGWRPGGDDAGKVVGHFGLNGTMGRLTRWDGSCILQTRWYEAGKYRTEDGPTHAIAFRLTNRRWIVGYSLGSGMLFRGYLLTDADDDDAMRAARDEAERWIDIDEEDRQQFEYERSLESADETD